MKLPIDFPQEYTFRDLNTWWSDNGRPNFIEMTYDQEFWYRSLLEPKFMVFDVVTFRGIPIKTYD